MSDANLLELTAGIVAAHLSSNTVATNDVPALITNVHKALASLGEPAPVEEVKQEPAVSIRASVKPDYIVCLEDGKKLKMLKRHLMSHYRLTPAEYRAKWNLPADYPMVAPNYANQRKELALKIGLGRKVVNGASKPKPAPMPEPETVPKAIKQRSRKVAEAAAPVAAPKTRKPRARKIETPAEA